MPPESPAPGWSSGEVCRLMAAIRAAGSVITDIAGEYVSIRKGKNPPGGRVLPRGPMPSAGLAAGALLLLHPQGLANAGGRALQLARGLLGPRHGPLRGAGALDPLHQRLAPVGQPLIDSRDLRRPDRASPVEHDLGSLGDELAGAEDREGSLLQPVHRSVTSSSSSVVSGVSGRRRRRPAFRCRSVSDRKLE